MNERIEGEEEAQRAILANSSKRARRLESYERWAKGTQYDHMPNWWDDSVPLWERRPCIVYKVVDLAARANVDLCLGGERYPAFTTRQAEDESDAEYEEESGLSREDSDKLDRFIRENHRISRFPKVAREMFYDSQTTGSVAAIFGVRFGKPFQDAVPSKWCTPKFGPSDEVVELEIRYPYTEEIQLANGTIKVVAKLYRRVITAEKDTEYLPADADKNGIEPNWVINKARSVVHGLGFCPVVWYPFNKGATTVNVIDGLPIHRYITDEIHQHDLARSQWHRGALLSEPQVYEIGVAEGSNPTETGRTPILPSSELGGVALIKSASSPNPMDHARDPEGRVAINGAYVGGTAQKARKKGPGHVWQYPNPESTVGALTYPGDALKAQEDNTRDLRLKLQESLAVVFLDPENIKFAATTSGKALQAIKQKQIDRCDIYRDDLADAFLDPAIQMQLRVAQSVMARNERLKVPGATGAKPILDRFVTPNGWEGPTVSVRWGAYYQPDPAEQRVLIEMVRQALGGGKIGRPMITLRVAVERIADIFGIENIGAIVDELLKEEADEQEATGDTGATGATGAANSDGAGEAGDGGATGPTGSEGSD